MPAMRVSPIWLGTMALAMLTHAGKAQPQADEYHVKAAFLFHFAQLADWPAETFSSGDVHLNFCTFGEDPFGGELEKTVEGKLIGSRSVRVLHLKQPQDIRGCQILFLGKRESKRAPALLEMLANTSVLTVGESDGFIHQGGMIRLSVENDRISFEINLATAERAGIKMSSKLLLLAKSVIRNQE
jgi:hypothetical protein